MFNKDIEYSKDRTLHFGRFGGYFALKWWRQKLSNMSGVSRLTANSFCDKTKVRIAGPCEAESLNFTQEYPTETNLAILDQKKKHSSGY